MPRNTTPDAYVTATDRNGRMLDRIEFKGRSYTAAEKAITSAKAVLWGRYGPDCYIFVNIYC